MLDGVAAGFESVGGLIEQERFRNALAEAMRVSSLANQYISDQAPWAVIKSDRARAGTILYVALQCVDNLKNLFTPFVPFSSQTLHELLGYDGWVAGPLEFRDVVEDDGSMHPILTGEYESWVGAWAPSELPPGQRLREPRPLFKKLEPSVVEEELARMASS